jgi:hypothetical protein
LRCWKLNSDILRRSERASGTAVRCIRHRSADELRATARAQLLRLAAGGAIGWAGGGRVQRGHPLHGRVGLAAKMGLTAKAFLRQDIIHEGVAYFRCVLLATMRASNRDRVAPSPRKGLRVGGKDRGNKPVSFRAPKRKTVRCRRPLHDHHPSGTKLQEAGGSTAAAVRADPQSCAA